MKGPERQKGGLGPRRRGDAFEVAVCADLERVGWWCARLRQGGGQLVDVIAIRLDKVSPVHVLMGSVTWHIQCKAKTPYMRPAERERFVMDAQNCGAVPVIAWKDGEIQYKVLT